MNILFLSDNFPPESNAPASRTHEHCRRWVERGHRVVVVTCAPNFPRGEVFEGYRNRLYQKETIDGIEVIRVWTYITANEGFAKRILDYLSFMTAAVPAAGEHERLCRDALGTGSLMARVSPAPAAGVPRRLKARAILSLVLFQIVILFRELQQGFSDTILKGLSFTKFSFNMQ